MAKDYYVIPIFVPHQGCPHDCIFCNQKRISGVQEVLNQADINNEIEAILSTLDYSNNPRVEIAFFGGSFTGIETELQEEYLEIGRRFIECGKVHGLRLSTRPDYIDDVILKRLKTYGVDVIELGVQSMHKDVLMASNRGHSLEDVHKACDLIKSAGFCLGIQLMPGLPNDSVLRFKETIDRMLDLKPSIVRLYPTLVIKETGLELDYEKGLYKPMSIEEAIEACAYGLERCIEAGIEVIRIGLQPTEAVSDTADVIAGPFHPTFRQLVEGAFFKQKIMGELDLYDHTLISEYPFEGKTLQITCHSKQISSVSGLNKRNKIALQEAFKFSKIKIIGEKTFEPYAIKIEVF